MDLSPNAASVALIRNGEVLLIQRAFEPWRGAWTLPGGRTEPGESAEDCARRELGEELGLMMEDLHPVTTMKLGASDRFRLAVFATTRFGGEIVPSNEIAAIRWVQPDRIAELSTTPDLAQVLTRAFALFRQGERNIVLAEVHAQDTL